MKKLIFTRTRSLISMTQKIDCYLDCEKVKTLSWGGRETLYTDEDVISFYLQVRGGNSMPPMVIDIEDCRELEMVISPGLKQPEIRFFKNGKYLGKSLVISNYRTVIVNPMGRVVAEIPVVDPEKPGEAPAREPSRTPPKPRAPRNFCGSPQALRGFSMDPKSKIFRVSGTGRPLRFDQLLSYWADEESCQVPADDLAAVGAALGGPVGAGLGAAYGNREAKLCCSSLSVKLRVKDSKPDREIQILTEPTPMDSPAYHRAKEDQKKILDFLTAIKGSGGGEKQKAADDSPNPQQPPKAKEPPHSEDFSALTKDLWEYKKLYDQGVLTEEEFIALKKKRIQL